MQTLVERFNLLFSGYRQRFGKYEVQRQEVSGKLSGRAQTVYEAVTDQDYESHLRGNYGIGIIPLTDNNLVHFAAIDIDKYGMSDDWHFDIAKRVCHLPLVVTKSKSNGAHIWAFSEIGVDAALMVDFLKEVSAQLGYAGCEIFPKQTSRAGRDDVGNWINLPYFGDSRQAVTVVKEGSAFSKGPQDLETFVNIAETIATGMTDDWLIGFAKQLRESTPPELNSDDWYDGPPCLQKLFVGDYVLLKKLKKALSEGKMTREQYDLRVSAECDAQLSEGGRNIGFFNAAQYLFRKYGDSSTNKVTEILNGVNVKSCLGLPHNEMSTIVKQGKKDYNYQCSRDPLKSFCNRALCKRREFGIGSRPTDVGIEVTGFTKILLDPPIYLFNIDGERVRMSSEELLNQRKFAAAVLDKASKVWTTLPEPKFKELLVSWMSNMTEMEGPPDSDLKSVVKRALIAFLAEKLNTSPSDEPYHNGKVLRKGERGEEAWFDLRFFDKYLRRESLQLDRRVVTAILQDVGCTFRKNGTTIAGKGCRPWIAFPAELEGKYD